MSLPQSSLVSPSTAQRSWPQHTASLFKYPSLPVLGETTRVLHRLNPPCELGLQLLVQDTCFTGKAHSKLF